MKKITLKNNWFKIFIKWEFRTIYNIEKKFNIKSNALYMRINRYLKKWISLDEIVYSIEDIIENVKMKSNEKYMYEWKYRTLKEIANLLWICHTTLCKKVREAKWF